MRTVCASLLLTAALATTAAAEDPFWRSWDDALTEARARGRPVVVDVYTDWCGWCRRMHRDTYRDDAVRAYLRQHFVGVRLNAEAFTPARYEDRAYTYRSLAARFRITGYPATIFLRADGSHAATAPGYMPPDRYLLLLRYVAERHLDRGVPFREFLDRAAGAAADR